MLRVNNMENVLKARRLSFLYSLLYVGLGTIAVFCSYPPYYGDWVLVLLILTFPVSVIGFGVMMAGKYYFAAAVIQFIVFLLTWYVVYKQMSGRFRK